MTKEETHQFVELLRKFSKAGFQFNEDEETNKKEIDEATMALINWVNEMKNQWQKDNNY